MRMHYLKFTLGALLLSPWAFSQIKEKGPLNLWEITVRTETIAGDSLLSSTPDIICRSVSK
jgi:hypothetical protein